MADRYAIIPECPEPGDLVPLAEVLCKVIGLPEDGDVHPSSLQLVDDLVQAAYAAIFNQFGGRGAC